MQIISVFTSFLDVYFLSPLDRPEVSVVRDRVAGESIVYNQANVTEQYHIGIHFGWVTEGFFKRSAYGLSY